MLVSNHMLIGSTIALTIKQPLLVVPLAFASHFVLDALPHFGYRRGGYREIFKHRTTYVATFLDVIGVAILLLTVATVSWLTCVAALIAAAPDTGWLYRFFLYERKGHMPTKSWYTHFHERIQWCERPWGVYVEIVFYFAVLAIVLNTLV